MKIHLLSESSWYMYQMGQVYLKEVVSSKMFSLKQYEILISNKKIFIDFQCFETGKKID